MMIELADGRTKVFGDASFDTELKRVLEQKTGKKIFIANISDDSKYNFLSENLSQLFKDQDKIFIFSNYDFYKSYNEVSSLRVDDNQISLFGKDYPIRCLKNCPNKLSSDNPIADDKGNMIFSITKNIIAIPKYIEWSDFEQEPYTAIVLYGLVKMGVLNEEFAKKLLSERFNPDEVFFNTIRRTTRELIVSQKELVSYFEKQLSQFDDTKKALDKNTKILSILNNTPKTKTELFAKFEKDIEEIKKLDFVNSAILQDDKILIGLKSVVLENFDIGEYTIEIYSNPSGILTLEVKNDILTAMSDENNVLYYQHPHITEGGDMCSGSLGNLKYMIVSGELLSLVYSIWELLHIYNEYDKYISLANFINQLETGNAGYDYDFDDDRDDDRDDDDDDDYN